MTFAAHLAAVEAGQSDFESLADLARLALAEGEEERALPLLSEAASRCSEARLWQWTGLLHRALDEHEAALASFAEATLLAPADLGIAHGRAHIAFEAGLDAVDFFEQARRLAPGNGNVLIGLAGAKFGAGRGEEAAAELDAVLARAPLWLQGHAQLAQLRSLLGQPGESAASLERALAALPGEAGLWRALFDLHVRRQDFDALRRDVERARRARAGTEFDAEYEVIALSETGCIERADALFQSLPAASRDRLGLWRIRHLLRSGRLDEAVVLIDQELTTDRAAAAWPYAASAWRLTGDPRSDWLEADPRFVAVIDLRREFPDFDGLADLLRSLHVARGEYLDQSVRGGTQTDGPLLSRIDPPLRALREAIVRAVGGYRAQLPDPDPRHPLLRHPRDRRIRFAGSWSVRLRDAGHHSNHVHPQGWISSALYVSLPDRRPEDDPHAGWLTLGEPEAALGLDLPPTRFIEPREGQLVLFPSWMWHGTRPFAQGERLTIAFDVAPPR